VCVRAQVVQLLRVPVVLVQQVLLLVAQALRVLEARAVLQVREPRVRALPVVEPLLVEELLHQESAELVGVWQERAHLDLRSAGPPTSPLMPPATFTLPTESATTIASRSLTRMEGSSRSGDRLAARMVNSPA